MADPYSPFTLGDAAGAVTADPSLAQFGRTTALAEELMRLARSDGDRTALAEELLDLARGALPQVDRSTPAEEALGSVLQFEGLLGKLARYAPVAAGVLQALHRGADEKAVAGELAAGTFAAMREPTSPAGAAIERFDAGSLADPPLPEGLDAGAASLRGDGLVQGVEAAPGGAANPGPVPRFADAGQDTMPLARSAAGDALPTSPAVPPSARASLDPGGHGRAAPADPPVGPHGRGPHAPTTSPRAATGRAAEAPASSLAQRLLGAFAGQQRLLEIDTALADAFLVERYIGQEAVCAPFKFEIDCLALSAFLDTRVLLGRPVALRQRLADQRWRHWHGLCTRVAPLGGDGGYARYRLTMEPWTALLALRRNALIFQDLDLRGILERVFADYPQASWRFDVTQPLPRRPITTQYRETDWEFVTRLLAEAGLAWRFEHVQAAAEGEAPAHALVVFDRQAALPDAAPAALRFHRVDASEREDAITHFTEQRQAVPDAVAVASWQAERVEALAAVAEAAPAGPHLPAREVYTAPSAGRYPQPEQAQLAAELRLDALRVPQRLHAGAGSARGLQAGAAFALQGHPDLDGQRFVPVAIEHVAANNLGTGIVALLDSPELERGSYRNRFLAVPESTALVPLPRPKPLAPGAQTARVVGLPDAANTASRDHQVRIQFPWQRGVAPQAGGLSDTGSRAHPEGHAPGDHTAGTWVRVAEWLAGPNWGSHALPRIGSEVLVEFLHADIDQPVIAGQLYNGEAAPPFAAGVDAGANHVGTLSGLHTRSLDGAGTQQWLVDDAPGQLRQRLHTSLGDSRLELGYLIDHHDGRRGALRGQGFDLATLGWANLRAGTGVLLSATARPGAASTQFDVAEAVAQLQGAQDTAQALSDAARQHQAAPLAANEAQRAFVAAVDPGQEARYTGTAGGQSATKPTGGRRDGGDPVERFARPLLFVEGPEHVLATTPASALAFAGQHLHLTVQDDAHLVAGQTFAAVSGRHTALFAQQGPIRAIAANGPLSLQAHAGPLELLADQSVTVTATDARVEVLANKKIVLQAGQTRITLEGGDITFACPGNFTVKASQHPFLGGASDAASLPLLPVPSQIKQYSERFDVDELLLVDEALAGAPFIVRLASGDRYSGVLDQDGLTPRVFSAQEEDIELLIGDGDWEVVEDVNEDDVLAGSDGDDNA